MDLCYEALNGSCGKYVRPNSVHVPMLIAVMLITFVTVIGNLLVIISIGHFKQLHTPTNQLILSLALCDFLLGLFVMPLSAVRSIQGCWYFGDFLCKLHTCVDITLSTASIFHLVSVSAERCCAVCGPLTYHSRIGFPTVLLMISTSWLIPAIFAYVITFFELNLQGGKDFYETHVRCVGGCHVFFSHGPAVVTSLVSFYIPGFIIIGIYSRIYMVAQNQARSINHQLNQLRRSYPSGSTQHRAWKATKTIAIVVGVFLPFTITKKITSGFGTNVMTSNVTDTENMFLCYPLLLNSCAKLHRLTVVKVVMYVFMVLMILTTVFGNLLIIISISHFKHLKSPTHLIVRSLAASDCLLGSLVMPYSMG
ncbi:unnamed protein product [Leuciscus chuanchicus]